MFQEDALNSISLITANFGNRDIFPLILGDWFQFLGGKPGEVVVVDGGSDRPTQEMYWDLFHGGKIDKLQLIRPDHPENDKERCFVQEYHVASMAGKPYLLFFKVDTLPFRKGLDNWLTEAVAFLDRPEVFAVSGSFNWNVKHHDAWPGWYYSQWCTENFALMKRDRFVAAMEEFAGEFIRAGFRGDNPAAEEEERRGRFLLEIGFHWYMQRHGLYTIVRQDDEDWTVLHTNLRGSELIGWRDKYLRREGVDDCVRRQWQSTSPYGIYYGHSRWSTWRRHARIALGASSVGGILRGLRRMAVG